jgi:hypothetical protein
MELILLFMFTAYRKRSHTAQSFPDAKKLFEEVQNAALFSK